MVSLALVGVVVSCVASTRALSEKGALAAAAAPGHVPRAQTERVRNQSNDERKRKDDDSRCDSPSKWSWRRLVVLSQDGQFCEGTLTKRFGGQAALGQSSLI